MRFFAAVLVAALSALPAVPSEPVRNQDAGKRDVAREDRVRMQAVRWQVAQRNRQRHQQFVDARIAQFVVDGPVRGTLGLFGVILRPASYRPGQTAGIPDPEINLVVGRVSYPRSWVR